MFKNYLKIAFRNLFKNKSLSVINILGLAVSIAVCFLITLFILHETSYDRFHHNPQNLYRVCVEGEISGQPQSLAVSMAPLSTALTNEFPEVEAAVKIIVGSSKTLISHKEQSFYETSIGNATEDFFQVFDFELIRGEKAKILSEPETIALSDELARRLFQDEDPLGKTITLNETSEYTVSGIYAEFPGNSHLQMKAIIALPYVEDTAENWGSFNGYNYIRLKENIDPETFSAKIRNLPMEKMGITKEQTGMEFLLFLEQVTDIHLRSDLPYNLGNDGDITYVYVFSIIALFILIIAYINFINLTTAHHMNRAKEIGVRKIIGADRKRLIFQFLLESVVVTAISTAAAFGLFELLLPVFSTLIGVDIGFSFFTQGIYLVYGIAFMLMMALLSGIYPAVYLSTLNPISIVKGNLSGNFKKSSLRNGLVVFQFIISIALISSTGIIYKQLRHFQSKKLGFDKEHVLMLPLRSTEIMENAKLLKAEFLNQTGIESVTLSSNYPGAGASEGHGFYPEGFSEEKPQLIKTMNADADFVKTFGLRIKEGRNFLIDNESEYKNVLINETLARELGWNEPLGKTFKDPRIQENNVMVPVTIVGVLEDFHVNPLRDKIEPMVLYFNSSDRSFISLRLEPGSVFSVLEFVEKKWEEMYPSMPFDYFFLDEHFDNIHRSEKNLAVTFMYFTVLAILIACLGLFGLASYATERRIKEIGVRKVLGSTVGEITMLLSKDFSKLVLMANVVAWPIAWYGMDKWLQSFAYRTEISLEIFLLSGLIAFIIALLTVSFHTIKAANANPVKALKYE